MEELATAAGRRITVRFHTLRFEQERLALQAAVTRFVNSKGHAEVDDAGRPVRVERGALVSDGPEITLDGGGRPQDFELKLDYRITPEGNSEDRVPEYPAEELVDGRSGGPAACRPAVHAPCYD